MLRLSLEDLHLKHTEQLWRNTHLFRRPDSSGFGFRFHRQQIGNETGEGFILVIVLGIVGAVIGDVNGLNIHSLLISVIGAVIVLVHYHADS